MSTKLSIYNIIEDIKHNADLYGNTPPLKPTINTVRKVMPGAPGRISFTISQTTKQKPMPTLAPKVAQKPSTKYNPADWPEEEDLPVPFSKQQPYKKPIK
jgi:hypothetical protein